MDADGLGEASTDQGHGDEDAKQKSEMDRRGADRDRSPRAARLARRAR